MNHLFRLLFFFWVSSFWLPLPLRFSEFLAEFWLSLGGVAGLTCSMVVTSLALSPFWDLLPVAISVFLRCLLSFEGALIGETLSAFLPVDFLLFLRRLVVTFGWTLPGETLPDLPPVSFSLLFGEGTRPGEMLSDSLSISFSVFSLSLLVPPVGKFACGGAWGGGSSFFLPEFKRANRVPLLTTARFVPYLEFGSESLSHHLSPNQS